MHSLKYKLLVIFGFALLAAASFNVPVVQAQTATVPNGCPGSAKPPADKEDVPANCSNIPAGCPGHYPSSDKAPSNFDASTCPYSAYVVGAAKPHQCGSGAVAVNVSIDIGCKGKGNPITDALFAIIRILSTGVGLVIVGSLVYAGIQYSASRGDPKATAEAITRIQSNVIALLIFIFGYAFLNYLLPAGFLR